MAKNSFKQMASIFKDRQLSIDLKVRLLTCYVWSVLLYGCESWTLSVNTMENLEAAEMWFYRRMLRISYQDRVTNETVLQRVHQRRQLLNTIHTRQISFVGHVIRKGELEELALNGKIKGKKARGRQRLSFLYQAKKSSNLTTERSIWDAALSRKFCHHVSPMA